MKLLRSLVLGFVSLSICNTALAIPPPDFLISGLQSAAQVFGVLVAFFISLFFLLKDTFKLWWQLRRRRCVVVLCALVSFGAIALLWVTKIIL